LCLLNIGPGDLNFSLKHAAGATLEAQKPLGVVTFAMEPVITGVIGLLFGSVIAWLALRSRTAGLSARLSLTEKELAAEKADSGAASAGSHRFGGGQGQAGIRAGG